MPQVNKITRIVLASVLKPVNDTRMTEKLARSLAHLPDTEVHVIGYPSESVSQQEGIQFHPHASSFQRISLKRILTPLAIFINVLRLKPDIYIITTHELLAGAVLMKVVFRCRVLYDIQENYFLNLFYGVGFPPLIRHGLAGWVRMKEWICSPFINLFLLAEQMYSKELAFAHTPIVLQNKLTSELIRRFRKPQTSGYSRLLFTGTLSETTGVYHAIELARKLHALDSAIRLTIIGHCPRRKDFNRIRRVNETFIELHAEKNPVAHEQILKAVASADFGIAWYPSSKSTSGSFPTKVFEYLALHLPLMIRHTDKINQFVTLHRSGILIPDTPDYPSLLAKMKTLTPSFPDNLYWEDEFSQVIPHLTKKLS